MPIALITSRDPKGRKFIDNAASIYDKMELTDEQAQLINERGGELKTGLRALLARLSAVGKTFDLTQQIEQLIAQGNHTACGMSAETYRSLWPTTVVQPPEYAGRLDLPLLVDLAIKPDRLLALNRNIEEYVKVSSCTDLVAAPRHENGTVLTRYVAWIQTDRWLNRKVADVRGEMPADEVGLVTAEGLHLPGQYEAILRKQAVDIPGSRCDEAGAPYVRWFDFERPLVHAIHVDSADPSYGSGSRGIVVAPVTW